MESLNNYHKWIVAITVAVGHAAIFFFIYFAYKEPKFVPDSDAFKMRGIYGVNIPYADIIEVDTIAWREIPGISIRANGISLFKVHRGKFRTKNGDKIHLNITAGLSPVIRIVERNGAVYYINRKNAAETRKLFKNSKIQKNQNSKIHNESVFKSSYIYGNFP